MRHVKCTETIRSLELHKVIRGHTPCIFLEQTDQGNRFIWEQDANELEHLICLIDALLDENCTNGHQYLEGSDTNYIIEFSYNEEN